MFQPKWELVADKRKLAIQKKCEKITSKIKQKKRVKPRLKVRMLFYMMRISHGMIDKSERKAGRERTKDYLHWQENGWLDGKKPWKD